MPLLLKSTSLGLVFLLGLPLFLRGDDSDPGEQWVTAYSWLQTGERLAVAEQWPIAMGSFIEASRQMKTIQAEHPEFEPEVVAYRLERLEETIAATQEKLNSGEHDIMMKFLDFIESYELGMKLRYQDQFVEALDTLDIARVLLDEIIYEKPDQFREAVDTQYQILHKSIAWIDSQINYKERTRPAIFVADGQEWGTTEFVKESDLPGEGDTILTSAELFPGVLAAMGGTVPDPAETEAEKESVKEEEKTPSSGGQSSATANPGFRMSSKDKQTSEKNETETDPDKN